VSGGESSRRTRPALRRPGDEGHRPRDAGTFAALSWPNYRLWFFGQTTSLFGTWMQSTAQGYLVFELTRSSAWLGYTGFAGGVAPWLFTLFGGVLADRVSRRSILVVTQALSMLLAFALSALVFARVVAPWHILALAFLLGAVNAFDAPARQSFVLEMVSREHLTNAIALNSTMFNAATVVGPAVGGLAYAAFGPGWCFVINGLSFVAVIAALLAMRLGPAPAALPQRAVRVQVVEGLRAIGAERRIFALIVLVALSSLFGWSFVTLIPAWAVKILGGDARTNGLLQSARGAGAVLAALGIASMGPYRGRGKLLTVGSLLYPVVLAGLSFTRSLPLSLAGFFLAGAAFVLMFNLANALVQTLVPDAVRGRVMSVYQLGFLGMAPIGSLAIGAAAERFGEPLTLLAFAIASLACTGGVALAVPSLRRIT
jgi:MFS family permease